MRNRFAVHALAIAATLAAFGPAPAASGEVPPGIAMLDPAIVHVRMLGTWETPEGRGPVRLALSRDAVDPGLVGLYVQWLKDGQVIAATEVPEIRANRFVVLDIRPDPGVGEIAVHLHVRAEGGDEPSPLLIIREPGAVEFRPAEN